MTKASLTERQAILPTPFDLISSAFCTKPGRCLAEQVGVKAPGSANSATFPLKNSSVETSFIPSAVFCFSLMPLGILSPTLIVIGFSLRPWLSAAAEDSDPTAEKSPPGKAGAAQRRQDVALGKDLGERLAVRLLRPIGGVERDAVAAEAAQIIADRRIGTRPVGAHRDDVAAGDQRRNRLAVQHQLLVHLAGEAPFGGDVDQHDLAIGH